MQRFQPSFASKLKRQNAPGMLQPTQIAGRRLGIHSPLRVDLIERQRHHSRLRGLHPDRLPEFAHRRQVGQLLRFVDEVVERDQRVGLAAAVGKR